MSILLEALKKSEAQRQLGSTPTLQTPMERSADGGNQIWIPICMLVSAAAAMSWIGWEQFRRPEMLANPAAEVVPAAEETERQQGVIAIMSGDGSAPAKHPDAATPSSLLPAAQRGLNGAEEDEPRQRLAKSVKSYESERPAPSRINGKRNAPASRTHKKSAAELPQSYAAQSADSSPVAERSGALETDSISFWQMPSSLRESMPELRITVLVYAERPENRFLLINGQRLREHEELESGVVLEEIQRSRAIFSYRNYRFHLKS